MKKQSIVVMILLFSTLVGCSQAPPKDSTQEIKALQTQNQELKTEIQKLKKGSQSTTSSKSTPLQNAMNVVQLLKNKDMDGISAYVHPTKGVRFSPYSFIDTKTDTVFTVEKIKNAFQDTQSYIWGTYDGSGEPIKMPFSKYYTDFIYNQDFSNPQLIGNNEIIGAGNTTNNVKEAYPKAHFVEFHFKGIDPQYTGMDWTSLRLVFEDVNGEWKLVGIIHDAWTI